MQNLTPSLVEKLEAAVRLEGRGELEEARAEYRSVVDLDPEAPEALSLLGKLEQRLGDHNAAVFHLRRAARLAPGRPDIHLGLGYALGNAGEKREAAMSFINALDADPGFAPAYVSLGRIYAEHGQDEKAIRAFENARNLDSAYPQIHYEMGVFYKNRRRIEPAISALMNCIRLRSELLDVHLQLAELLLDQGEFGQALDHIDIHLKTHPDDSAGWVLRAVAQLELGDPEEASQCAQTALQYDPRNALALVQLGQAQLKKNDMEGAQRSFGAALKLDENNLLAHAGIAAIFEMEGRYDDALRRIRHAGDPKKYNLKTALLCSRILHSRGQTDDAIRLLNFRLKERLDPVTGRRQCYYQLGHMLENQNKFDAAYAHFQNANDLSNRRFDQHRFQESIETTIRFFSRDRLARLNRARPQKSGPVFIIGLPGTGLSAISSLLCAHSRSQRSASYSLYDIAKSLGEKLVSENEFPDAITDARSADLRSLAAEYIAKNKCDLNGHVVIDDHVQNAFYLGLASLLFPTMRVIHVSGNPMDIALDIYTGQKSGVHMEFAYSLKSLGQYAKGVRQLASHWSDTGEMRILDVRIENLVRNPAAIMQRVVAFAGLDWHPSLLRSWHKHSAGQNLLGRTEKSLDRHHKYRPFMKAFNAGFSLPDQ